MLIHFKNKKLFFLDAGTGSGCIILSFLEESEDDWATPLKIGNLFFNRFGADEDAAFESVGVYNLLKSSGKMARRFGNKEYKNFENERKEKGMDINHIYVKNHFITSIIG